MGLKGPIRPNMGLKLLRVIYDKILKMCLAENGFENSVTILNLCLAIGNLDQVLGEP